MSANGGVGEGGMPSTGARGGGVYVGTIPLYLSEIFKMCYFIARENFLEIEWAS